MPDTQWPRYMVFQQEQPGDVFIHNSTVHAPDAEIALLNARDVFARRPQAYAMWVVPNEAIFTKTREEIENDGWGDMPDSQAPEDFHIFGKTTQQGQLQHLGTQAGATAEDALRQFVESYSGGEIWFWWSFPVSAVTSTADDEAESFFRPFEAHEFKDQANYPVITMMRQIKARGKLEDR